MPRTPGTSQEETKYPATWLVMSTTWDPFVGIEAGRTYASAFDPARATETKKGK